jgi:hypothetical protein
MVPKVLAKYTVGYTGRIQSDPIVAVSILVADSYRHTPTYRYTMKLTQKSCLVLLAAIHPLPHTD